MSTEWYTRLEKGHISGVSEDVLAAVSQAPQLDEDERTYLFDLARAAWPAPPGPCRPARPPGPPTARRPAARTSRSRPASSGCSTP
ncbi:hypothetical protein [Streptomyces sp. NBC_00236]|uniref:hypothetical protein n=1 Tax=Streptomyces sp. NBC_00236 TaxID=2903639 RepID=UPI002E2CA44D|nr:hypothetical protein [Streptomyces sp. NBC_00236]